ncbi:MAG: hypothetical protein WCE38_11340 [Burkholderiales bacterium]
MSRRAVAFALVAALTLAATLLSSAVSAQNRFSFALVGDTPYLPFEAQAFASMLAALDAEPLAFVVHVGDIKAARTHCDDTLFMDRKRLFEASRHPFVFIPGDNEWTDCHASGTDPVERLGALRRIFFAGNESLGERHIPLTRQSSDPRFAEYRENVRWIYGDILYVALNVPGSNNNLGRTAEMDAEHRRRMAAVFAWLEDSMQLAERRRVPGVVVLIHADPGFDGQAQRPRGAPDGYVELRDALHAHARWFGRPMLLGHGDGHVFRNDHPLRDPVSGVPLGNFTRVEVPGSPSAEAVMVDVDPASSSVFSVRPPASQAIFPENP